MNQQLAILHWSFVVTVIGASSKQFCKRLGASLSLLEGNVNSLVGRLREGVGDKIGLATEIHDFGDDFGEQNGSKIGSGWQQKFCIVLASISESFLIDFVIEN